MKLKIEVVKGNKLTTNHSYIILVYSGTIDNPMLRTHTPTGDKTNCRSISRKEYWSI